MNFRDAKERLVELANGRYCAITFDISVLNSREKPKCSMYIDGVGHVSDYPTWEDAIEALETKMGIRQPAGYDHLMPVEPT